MDYLFWILYHFHKRSNKNWGVFLSCSGLVFLILTYVFVILKLLLIFSYKEIFVKMNDFLLNSSDISFVIIFLSLTLLLFFIYKKRSVLIEKSKRINKKPTKTDYLILILLFIVPFILLDIFV